MYRLCRCIISLLALSSTHFTLSEMSSEHEIFKNIFTNYEKSIRPVKNISTVTVVKMFPSYLFILNMDAALECIEYGMDFRQSWRDENLQWNPADFAGIKTIRVPEEIIWSPDIAIVDSLTRTDLIPVEKRKVRIDYDGTVSQWCPQIVTCICEVKVDDFPFDTQTCHLEFSPWMYPLNLLRTEHDASLSVNNEDIKGNSEWQLISFQPNPKYYNTSDGDYLAVAFAVVIKRNATYYVCVLIIPTFIITTLSVLGIFSPFNNFGDREEKVSLGLTALLTIAVILNIVAAEMPKTTKLPLLGYFVLVELVICAIAILLATLIMFLHERALVNRWRPPGWLTNLLMRRKDKQNRYYPSRIRFPSIINDDGKTHAVLHSDLYVVELSLKSVKLAIENSLKSVENCIEERKAERQRIEHLCRFFDNADLISLIALQMINIIVTGWLLS